MATEKVRNFAERVRSFRKKAGLSQDAMAKKLGVSGDYIYLLEQGKKEPGGSLELLFELMEESPLHGSVHPPNAGPPPPVDKSILMVMAKCDDPEAFGVGVTFDSMSPALEPGDIVIVTPSVKPRHGDIVCVQHPVHGQMIRIYNVEKGNLIRLSAINPAWRDLVESRDGFDWIYPTHSFVRALSKSQPQAPSQKSNNILK